MEGLTDCIFCKIVSKQISVPLVFEDELFICIRDIHPQAPSHFLVIPKEHTVSLETAFPEHGEGKAVLVGKLFEVATRIARQQGLLPQGFRAVINTGKESGQTVFHLHLHVLGGEPLRSGFA